ncbi:MAG: hypothetical protein QM315_05025 [Bacillota bacterium]|jgi:hypothetical protein|nr:hypothetical protein [Bacillota bacterium]NLV63677.1 hypothetical protein [Clostridiaceae bacterium]
MLTVSGEYIDNVVLEPIQKDEEYGKAKDKFYEVIEKLQGREKLDVEAAANWMESKSILLSYRNGFNDGIRFILDAITGKEVFEYGKE